MSKAAERTAESNDSHSASALRISDKRQCKPDRAVEETIKRRIRENGAYAFYFSEVTCTCFAGVVKVRGRVPTDRLKHALWSLLGDLDGITEINDQLWSARRG